MTLALKDPEVALGWAGARRGWQNLLHKTSGYVFIENLLVPCGLSISNIQHVKN